MANRFLARSKSKLAFSNAAWSAANWAAARARRLRFGELGFDLLTGGLRLCQLRPGLVPFHDIIDLPHPGQNGPLDHPIATLYITLLPICPPHLEDLLDIPAHLKRYIHLLEGLQLGRIAGAMPGSSGSYGVHTHGGEWFFGRFLLRPNLLGAGPDEEDDHQPYSALH